jgi:CubicO group peptidase (beta-lactamase class C family)
MIAHVVVQDGALVSAEGDAAEVPWWSFTKTVLAAAALALVRDGHLTLDDPLDGRDYSLRQLLQHRAGLRDYGTVPGYQKAVASHDDAWSEPVMFERARARDPLYRPGEGWAYSNIGYFFVRQLIERTTRQPLAAALSRLVLSPLGIEEVRLATRRGELAAGYDPRWAYPGVLIGPLRQAALLLDRLLCGDLLGEALISAMIARHPVGGSYPGRPWVAPGYGLGLMTGTVTEGTVLAGHTGGGPGSVIAVYRGMASGRTAAAFTPGDDQGAVEQKCLDVLT